LRNKASILGHWLRVAMRGRRFRRGSTVTGPSHHDCASTARRLSTRQPVRALGRAFELDGAYAVA
jgi:hypothetical protein